MIVADANLILHYVVDGDVTSLAEQCRRRDPVWIVPPLWHYEVINVLARNVRSDDSEVMTVLEAAVASAWSEALVRVTEIVLAADDILRLSYDRKLGGYDAHYVLLAQRLGTRCVTADQKMLDRAQDFCVSIEDFSAGR